MNDYLIKRNKYLPKEIKAIFILESPPYHQDCDLCPEDRPYFYNENGNLNETLFSAFMEAINYKPENKIEGLDKFQKIGLFLMDAVDYPINKDKNGKIPNIERVNKIVQNYTEFKKQDILDYIGSNKSVPIFLVTRNVLNGLENLLKEDKFNVLNKGQLIPFPAFNKNNINRFINFVKNVVISYI